VSFASAARSVLKRNSVLAEITTEFIRCNPWEKKKLVFRTKYRHVRREVPWRYSGKQIYWRARTIRDLERALELATLWADTFVSQWIARQWNTVDAPRGFRLQYKQNLCFLSVKTRRRAHKLLLITQQHESDSSYLAVPDHYCPSHVEKRICHELPSMMLCAKDNVGRSSVLVVECRGVSAPKGIDNT